MRCQSEEKDYGKKGFRWNKEEEQKDRKESRPPEFLLIVRNTINSRTYQSKQSIKLKP